MASRNTQVELPPTFTDITSENKVTTYWLQWFSKIRYFLSNENHQEITGASDINLDAQYVSLDATSGSYAVTLEAPTLPGRTKTIHMTTAGGHNVTLALTNVIGGTGGTTTATFDADNDTLVLESLSNKWLIVRQYNVTIT